MAIGTTNFPTALDTAITLFETTDRAITAVSVGVGTGDTTINVTSTALFPTTGAITIENEIIYYTGKSGTTFTGCIRASSGTTAATHAIAAVVNGHVISGHHLVMSSSIRATQTKLGYGASSQTPTTTGHVLTVTGAGQTAWAVPPAGAWGSITGTLSAQTDLVAALGAKQDAGSYISSVTGDVTITGAPVGSAVLASTVTGNRTFSGSTKFGAGTNFDEPAQFGGGLTPAPIADAYIKVALGTHSVPHEGTLLTPSTPSVIIQKFLRNNSGINLQTGMYVDQLNNANNDHFDIASHFAFTPDLTSVSGKIINSTNVRGYFTLGGTNYGTNLVNAYSFISSVNRITTTGNQARGVAYYGEVLNSTIDAEGSFAFQNSLGVFVGHAGGTKLSSALLVSEAGGAGSGSGFRRVFSPGTNSICGTGFDFFTMGFQLSGTWTSSGTTTLAGSSGNAIHEVEQGAWILFNGAFHQVASIPVSANAIVVTATVTTQAVPQTVTMRTPWARIANCSPLLFIGNDDSTTYAGLTLDRSNQLLFRFPGSTIFQSSDGVTSNVTLTTGGIVNARVGYQIAGVALAASNLSNGTSGSGAVVLVTSATLVTPLLGIPTSGTLTNCTGLPISTGVSGLGTGVATFLATPSSANLASAVTNETGSGALVFGTTPTFTTSIITPVAVGGIIAGSTIAINGTSDGSPSAADILLNSAYSTSAAGSVRIGTTTGGAYRLVVADVAANIVRFISTAASGSGAGAGIQAANANTPSALGHRLAFYTFGASDGIAGTQRNSVLLGGFAEASWTDGSSHPSYFTIETCPPASTTRVERFRISASGNVIAGGGSGAALSTSATDGFFYIPTCAGAPTGDSTDYTGRIPMIWDSSNNKLWVNTSGTTWKGVVLA